MGGSALIGDQAGGTVPHLDHGGPSMTHPAYGGNDPCHGGRPLPEAMPTAGQGRRARRLGENPNRDHW